MSRSTRMGWAIWVLLLVSAAAGQEGLPPGAVTAMPIDVDAEVAAVTMYIGRASVTRAATVALEAGAYELRFTALPPAVQPETIQAWTAAPVRVLSVEYEQRRVGVAELPAVAELDRQIEAKEQQLLRLREQYEVLEARRKFIDAASEFATERIAEESGTKAFDLDTVRDQLAFVEEQSGKLVTDRQDLDAQVKRLDEELALLRSRREGLAGEDRESRTAMVTVTVPQSMQARVELTYLVTDASWSPRYNVRAALEDRPTVVEYDAMLQQRTGEDWDDVALTLSTAQPMVAANPPELEPWYVDVYEPAKAGREAAEMMRAEPRRRGLAVEEDVAAGVEIALGDKLERLGKDAAVAGGGPAVTFQLPRLVTVKSQAQQHQRTRIATIETIPQFVHVAKPLLTDNVYVRGELVNASAYQLLPGQASIFLGQDYVGATQMSSVAPAGTFKLYFGIDRAVQVTRRLVEKTTSRTGLLGGGLKTSYHYRIEIDNGTGRAIDVELWDRIPVSRSDAIEVDLVEVNPAPATDTDYVEEDRPRGLLKWVLSLPAGAQGQGAFAVTYGLRINRSKDTQITPLPE